MNSIAVEIVEGDLLDQNVDAKVYPRSDVVALLDSLQSLFAAGIIGRS